MRITKFRAWDIKQNGFVAGFNMVNYHGYFNKGLKPSIFRYNTEWEDGEYILEQFTGLHDKNGKEIYEGDIVNLTGGMPGGTNVFTVKYDDMMAVFELRSDDTEHLLGEAVTGFNAVSVIGNIHENPELLGEPK